MKRTTPKSLLVVVNDPYRSVQPVISKAADIARHCHATLTLLHVFSIPIPPVSAASSRRIIKHSADVFDAALEKIAGNVRRSGVKVKCAVEWDYPLHEAIVRYVRKHRIDLVVVESRRHTRLGRWFMANTDWELIRACPAPVWFAKTGALSQSLTVLAAVDPMHARAKPAGLDDRILGFSNDITSCMEGTVIALHAYEGRPPHTPASPPDNKQYRESVHNQVLHLAKRHHVDVANAMIKSGSPSMVLPKVAGATKADVVVMGAVSRSGVEPVFIGNTAEQVIDHLQCDVVIVKPAGFKSRVPARRIIALKSFR